MNQRFGYLGRFKNRAHTHVSVAYLQVRGHHVPVLAAVVPAVPRARGRVAGVRAVLGLATAGLWLGRSWLLPRGAAAACHRVVLHPRSHCASTAAITQPLLLLTFSLLHAHGLAPPALAFKFAREATPSFQSLRLEGRRPGEPRQGQPTELAPSL